MSNDMLLLEFSLEENVELEKIINNKMSNEDNVDEKYFVDGIGYFTLTYFDERCYMDCFILTELALSQFIEKEIIALKQTHFEKNIYFKTNDTDLFLNYINGAYSTLIFKNNTFAFTSKKFNKTTTINYSIEIKLEKNKENEDIINLGYWLVNQFNVLLNEIKNLNIFANEFKSLFIMRIIPGISFLKNYYLDLFEYIDDNQAIFENYILCKSGNDIDLTSIYIKNKPEENIEDELPF